MSFDIVIIKSNVKEVSSVAVVNDGKILMGKRNDNGRWTLPGGGLDKDEDSTDGAVRELHEEAGIKVNPEELKHLRTKKIKTHTGKTMTIHAYQYEWDGEKPTSKNDPDKEVKKWEWIDYSDEELPEEVASNLHSPKNVVLQAMGLIKGETMKSNFSFFIDLVKGAGHHKYLRKFRKGDKWVYIYYEPNQRPRHLEEEALKIIQKMADLGHEGAKKMLEQTTDVSDKIEEIKARLRTIAPQDRDSVRARADRDELNREYGIDKEGEELEQQLIPAKVNKRDTVEKLLTEEQKKLLSAHLDNAVDLQTFSHLNGHKDNPLYKKLVENNVTAQSIKEGVMGSQNLKEAMARLNQNLKKMDEAHAGLTPQSSFAKDQGYPNAIYNHIVKKLEQEGVLPQGYSSIHKRVNGEVEAMPKASELEAKMEEKKRAEEAERLRLEEEERREMATIMDTMAYHMVSLKGGSVDAREVKELNKVLKTIFKKPMKKEDFPYNFEDKGFKTKITSISVRGSNEVRLGMEVINSKGQNIMERWERTFSLSNGRPHIENNYMVVKTEHRGGCEISTHINAGQRQLMKSIPGGGVIRVHANIDIGAYQWSNQGFTLDESDLSSYKREFKSFLATEGVTLTPEELNLFKHPCHFSMFTDGKKRLTPTSKNAMIPLSAQQLETKSLSGVVGEHPLTEEEIRTKKANRMLMTLGKKFSLRRDWTGDWDSEIDNEASKFADAFMQMKEKAVVVLSQEYQNLLNKNNPPVNPDGTPETISQKHMRLWQGTGSGSIRMTSQRIAQIVTWGDADFNDFIIKAKLTRDSRKALNEARRANGGISTALPF